MNITSHSSFSTTVCQMVRPMLSDGCAVCPVCLSVLSVYCSQSVGWIKTKVGSGTEVGLGPGHIVLGCPPAVPKYEAQPQFLAHGCCGQTAGWIKMPLGTEVRLGPGNFVLDWNSAPPKGAQQPPHFLAYVL